MPTKVIGKTVYHKVQGKWKVKAHAKSPERAKRMDNLLRAVSHGWKPTGKKGK